MNVNEALDLLRRHNNLLVSGPPGTGKTLLLAEVAERFVAYRGVGFDPTGSVPFPASNDAPWMPSPGRLDRESFWTAFHPGTRRRHLMRDLEPVTGGGSGFQYSQGVMYRANQHALKCDGAALLVIDEINRGPAVEVFGDTVVCIDRSRRLGEGGEVARNSTPVLVPNDDGVWSPYYFSRHLYIVAAMNPADTSVMPIDLAFFRRWAPLELRPETEVVRQYLLPGTGVAPANGVVDLLEAAITAWERVNRRIMLLRGDGFQLGHAIWIPEDHLDYADPDQVLGFVRHAWSLLEQHVRELFFGDVRRQGAVWGNAHQLATEVVGSESVDYLDFSRPSGLSEWTEMFRRVADVGG